MALNTLKNLYKKARKKRPVLTDEPPPFYLIGFIPIDDTYERFSPYGYGKSIKHLT